MAGNTTPIDAGTDVGDLIAGKLYGRSLIKDAAGADAMGLVTASPAATSLLGRLKAIADAITGGIGVTGTFWQATQPVSAAALPLPAGAATQTTLAAAAASASDSAPASSAGAVTPSDTTTLTAKAIWVGGTGNVVATIGGSDVTFTGVPAGTLLPIKATKIKAATTATNIVWLG